MNAKKNKITEEEENQDHLKKNLGRGFGS